uniref:Uncharacterized protein n=1 Tax=Colobus angolensis palliatus TaxID=336983 RepID=A0A2K5HDU7_COLAP
MRMERDVEVEIYREREMQRPGQGVSGEVKRKALFIVTSLSSNDLHKMRRCLAMPPIPLSGPRA